MSADVGKGGDHVSLAIAKALRPRTVPQGLALGFAAMVLDLILVSRGHVETLLGLARESSPLQMAVGVSVNLAPFVALLAFVWAACRATSRFLRCSIDLTGLFAMVGLGVCFLWILPAATSPTLTRLSWIVALVIVVLFVAQFLENKLDSNTAWVPLLVAWATILTLMGSMGASLNVERLGRMWLPAERITIEGRAGASETSLAGYVLSVGDRWTTIVEESTRTLHVVPSVSVVDRRPCWFSDQRWHPRRPGILPGTKRDSLGDASAECPASRQDQGAVPPLTRASPP